MSVVRSVSPSLKKRQVKPSRTQEVNSKIPSSISSATQKKDSGAITLFRNLLSIDEETVKDTVFMRAIVRAVKKDLRSEASLNSVLTDEMFKKIAPNLKKLGATKEAMIGAFPIDILLNVIHPLLVQKNEGSEFFKGHKELDTLGTLLWGEPHEMPLNEDETLTLTLPPLERAFRRDLSSTNPEIAEAAREKIRREEIDQKVGNTPIKIKYFKREPPIARQAPPLTSEQKNES